MEKWSVTDVSAWLRANNLSRYEGSFSEYDVDGMTLLMVRDEQDCQELGVSLRVHRRKLLSLICAADPARHVGKPGVGKPGAGKPGANGLSTQPTAVLTPPPHIKLEKVPSAELVVPPSLKHITVALSGHPGSGLGLELVASCDGDCIVATVTSPSAAALGIQVGDVLVAIDDVDVSVKTGFRVEDIVSLLRSKMKAQTTTVSLHLIRGVGSQSPLPDSEEEAGNPPYGAVPREEDMLGSPYADSFALGTNSREDIYASLNVSQVARTPTSQLGLNELNELRDSLLEEAHSSQASRGLLLSSSRALLRDDILEKEWLNLSDVERERDQYKRGFLIECAEKHQSAIENERAMIELQNSAQRHAAHLELTVSTLTSQLEDSQADGVRLSEEINRLNAKNELLKQRMSDLERGRGLGVARGDGDSDGDSDDRVSRSVDRDSSERVERALREELGRQREAFQVVSMQLRVADEMKEYLSSKWAEADAESKRLSDEVVISAEKKAKAFQSLAHVDQLINLLSKKMRRSSNDRGLKLAVKDEWRRMLKSNVVAWFFHKDGRPRSRVNLLDEYLGSDVSSSSGSASGSDTSEEEEDDKERGIVEEGLVIEGSACLTKSLVRGETEAEGFVSRVGKTLPQ